jgi:hypothetical protein
MASINNTRNIVQHSHINFKRLYVITHLRFSRTLFIIFYMSLNQEIRSKVFLEDFESTKHVINLLLHIDNAYIKVTMGEGKDTQPKT